MTALAVMPSQDRFVIASDGAVCDSDTGVLIGLASKTVLIPEWSCVFAARGFGGIAPDIYRHVGWRRDFDDMLTAIGPASQELHSYYIKHYNADCHWSMAIAGWSAARERPEMYFLRSREYKMQNLETGTLDTIEPYKLHETWSLYAAPMPNIELRRQFGINLDNASTADPIDLTCSLVAAARLQPDGEFAESTTCLIGGFIQSTVLTPDSITTNIVHRWQDLIGQNIDPTCGPPFHGNPTKTTP